MYKVLHYKETNLSEAPDELMYSLKKYFGIDGFVTSDMDAFNKADIIHFHNRYRESDLRKKELIQFHSEPELTDHSSNLTSLVVAQYQATLPQYSRSQIVRNVINFDRPEYGMKNHRKNKKLRVGFSPSKLSFDGFSSWNNKGYLEKLGIFNALLAKCKNIEFDVIHSVSLGECLKRKSECDIIIDECMTPSYHRSGLEGLALGKITICSLGDDVCDVLKKASGSHEVPFLNIGINKLKDTLFQLSELSKSEIMSAGEKNRDWMESHWHPREISREYVNIYQSL